MNIVNGMITQGFKKVTETWGNFDQIFSCVSTDTINHTINIYVNLSIALHAYQCLNANVHALINAVLKVIIQIF